MGKRGPRPKPSAIEEAAGKPGRRPLNDGEPLPPAGEVAAPAMLSPEAREIWDQLAPICVGMKCLTTADVHMFAVFCEAYARWLELRRICWGHGAAGTTIPVYEGTPVNGKPAKIRHIIEIPQAAELRNLTTQLRHLSDLFGLTPSARSRLRIIGNVAPPIPTNKDVKLRAMFAGGGAKPKAHAT